MSAKREMLSAWREEIARMERTEKEKCIKRLYEIMDFNEKMLNTSSIGILAYKATGKCVFANYAAGEIVGTTAEKLMEQDFHKIKSWKPAMYQTALKALRTGKEQRLDSHIVTSFGKDVWLRNRFSPFNSGGEKHLLLFISEITGLKNVEAELRKAEERYHGIFSNADNCIAVYSAVDGGRDFAIREFNRAAEKAEKIRRDRVIGKRVTEVFPGVIEFGIFDVFKRVWRTGKPERFPAKIYKDRRIAGWRDNYIYKLSSGEVVAIYKDVTKEKKAEEELLISEKKYRELAENVSVIVYSADPRTLRTTYVNSVVKKVYGYTADEWIRDPGLWESIIHPDDRQRVFAEMAEYRRKQEAGRVRYRIVRRNKTAGWCEDIFNWERDAKGKVVALNGMVVDITKEKEAEEELRIAEEKYRTIVESSTDQIFMVDKGLRIISANRKIGARLGRPQEELLGKGVTEIFAAEMAGRIARNCRHVLETGVGISSEERMPANGKEGYLSISLNPVMDTQRRIVAVAGILRDITRVKGTEEALRDIGRHYHLLFDNSPVALIEADFSDVKKLLDRMRGEGAINVESAMRKRPDRLVAAVGSMRVLDMNLAAMRVFESRNRETVKRRLNELLAGELAEELMKHLASLLGKRKNPRMEVSVREGPGDRPFSAIVETTFLPGSEGNWKKVLLSISDVTELKMAQEEIRSSREALEKLSEATVEMEMELMGLRRKIKKMEAGKSL